MKQYFSNPRHNKAALLLASMSPDMVRDIADLFGSQGSAVLSAVAEQDTSTPRPLALFSREFIDDQDFPEVYLGATTAMLAQFRTTGQDNDFYEKVLVGAYNLPANMAKSISDKIETLDPIGGYGTNKARDGANYEIRMSWFDKMQSRFQEWIRRKGNDIASFLGTNWENDQTQKYDLDVLYEFKLLGRAVDELNSRARLMKGQFAISTSLGMLRAAGDVFTEPDDAADAELVETIRPLMGNPLPGLLFGGLKALVGKATATNSEALKKLLHQGGYGDESQATRPEVARAIEKVVTDNPSTILQLNPNVVGKDVIQLIANHASSKAAKGDVTSTYATVKELYGDLVADKWADGNLPGMMTGIIDMAGQGLNSTGDPELDEAIISDVLACDQERGDLVDEEDAPEIGGLFKRARINKQLRKARRLNRRNDRRAARQGRKDAQNQALTNAQSAANAAAYQTKLAQQAASGAFVNTPPAQVVDSYNEMAHMQQEQPFYEELYSSPFYEPPADGEDFSAFEQPWDLSYFQ